MKPEFNGQKVKRAGTLLYMVHPKTNHVYFRYMIPSKEQYGGSMPQIPKGKIDEGYGIYETAIKECCEETGCREDNIKDAELLNHYPDMKMVVYIATVKDLNGFGEPCHETKKSGWLNYNTQRHLVRDIQVHIFDEAFNYINEIY